MNTAGGRRKAARVSASLRVKGTRESRMSFFFASVLGHKSLEDGLSVILAKKLHTPELSAIQLRDLIHDAMAADISIGASIRADLLAARTHASGSSPLT